MDLRIYGMDLNIVGYGFKVRIGYGFKDIWYGFKYYGVWI